MTLLLRTAGDPAALAGPAKALVQQLDSGIAPYSATTLSAFIGASDFRQRVGSQLLGLFGVLGLLLASIGLYGVLSFQVARRTREIGIRMALGSSRGEILGLVLRQGASLVGLGLAIGIVGAAGLAQLLRSLLLGVRPVGPAGLRRCRRGAAARVVRRVPRARPARDACGSAAGAAARVRAMGKALASRGEGRGLDERTGGLVMATLSMSDELGALDAANTDRPQVAAAGVRARPDHDRALGVPWQPAPRRAPARRAADDAAREDEAPRAAGGALPAGRRTRAAGLESEADTAPSDEASL